MNESDLIEVLNAPSFEDLDASWLSGGPFDRHVLLHTLLLRTLPQRRVLHLPSKMADVNRHQLWFQLQKESVSFSIRLTP